ncbi:hypothetical protein ['Camptotheca acuminata' phytoplasma]|uniref:hypothetical protein n=1 Tax='Camptotheca acuminata' phytoplasma TaxID=3239192 RepID=UPI00351A98B2
MPKLINFFMHILVTQVKTFEVKITGNLRTCNNGDEMENSVFGLSQTSSLMSLPFFA